VRLGVVSDQGGVPQQALYPHLQIPQLGELFETVIQPAGKRLCAIMHDFVRADVSALRKTLSTMIARIGLLARVPTLMCLSPIRGPVNTEKLRRAVSGK
jgi:hypothetical protein